MSDSPAKSIPSSRPTRLHMATKIWFCIACTRISHSKSSMGSAFVFAVGMMTRSAPLSAHVRMLSGRCRSKQITMPTRPHGVPNTRKPSSDGV